MGVRSRRFKEWRTSDPAANTITAGTAESTALLFGTLEGETIIRLLIDVTWHGLTVDTATAYYAGIIVGPSTLDAGDIDPDANPELDWMWWYGSGTRQPAYDGVDSFVERHERFDLRAARRVDDGEDVFFAENCAGANVVSYVKTRALILRA